VRWETPDDEEHLMNDDATEAIDALGRFEVIVWRD